MNGDDIKWSNTTMPYFPEGMTFFRRVICASKAQPILEAIQKQIITTDGKTSSGGYALCSICVNASTLDLRVPVEQRRG